MKGWVVTAALFALNLSPSARVLSAPTDPRCQASASAPQFQLVYQLRDALMSGKFQMRMPGQAEWKSDLEWSDSGK